MLGTRSATLRILDLKSGLVGRAWRHTGSNQAVAAVRAIAVLEERQWVISGLTSGDVTIFDLRAGLIL